MKPKLLILSLLAGMMIPQISQAGPNSKESGARIAEESKSFDELMQSGIRFYNEGKNNPENYQKALEAFRQARRKEPDETITAYNIARTFHRLGNCEQALNHYLWYANATEKDRDRKDVSEYISELTKQCGENGRLVLSCEPSEARVSIDGERGIECSGVHNLKSGEHRLSFTAEGYKRHEESVTIETGQKEELNIVLKADKTEEVFDRTSAEDDHHQRVLFWTGIALNAAGIAITTTGGALLAVSVDQNKNKNRRDNAKFGTGIALAGVGAAAVGVGLWLVIENAMKMADADKKRLEPYQQLLSVSPVIQFTGESASAGINITF